MGRHLVIDDAVASTVYRNAILTKACAIPWYVAKLAEGRKFADADKASPEPAVSRKHTEATMSLMYLLPLKIWWHTGRAHMPLRAIALPKSLLGGVSSGGRCLQLPGSQPSPSHPSQAGLPLDTTLAATPFYLAACISLSQQILRLYCPAVGILFSSLQASS